jgi:hypothetical protein
VRDAGLGGRPRRRLGPPPLQPLVPLHRRSPASRAALIDDIAAIAQNPFAFSAPDPM